MKIVDACQQGRKFAEELDEIKKLGGVDYILEGLGTSIDGGIDIATKEKREFAFLSNKKPVPVMKTFCQLIFEALNDFVLKILCVFAAVSLVIEVSMADPEELPYSWIEGAAIFAAVVICSVVAAANDYQKERQF